MTDSTAVGDAFRFEEELRSLLDRRTLALIDHRRRGSRVKRRGWLVRRTLLVADLLGLSLAFLFTELALGLESFEVDRIGLLKESGLFALALPAWVLAAKLHRLYDHDEERTDHSTIDDVGGVFHLVTVGVWVAIGAAWLTGIAQPQIPKLLLFWALAILFVTVLRVLARTYCRRQVVFLQNTVIVGTGEVGQIVARKLLKHPEYGLNLVGFVDGDPQALGEDLSHLALLGPSERVPDLVRLLDVDRVIVAYSGEPEEELVELIRGLNSFDVQVDVVPRFFGLLSPGLGIHTVEGLPLIGLPPPRLSRSSLLIKRSFDLLIASILLLLLAPLFPFVAWRIKRDSPGPVFFRQPRMGTGDRPFEILKLRTMVLDADSRKHELAHLNGHGPMFKIEHDPRVTPFGRFLRRYFLDELPQLINVLRGEMSLVGPRPLVLDEDRHIGNWGRRRLDLKPGMTGLWQVLGRNGIAFDEMVALDYVYVSSWTLWEDFRLLGRTVPLVLNGSGGSV